MPRLSVVGRDVGGLGGGLGIGGWGGGRLDSNYASMSVSKSEGHESFFCFVFTKKGVKFAVSLNMGRNLC